MLREIELANVDVDDVTWRPGQGCGTVELKVPMCKADWKAKGLGVYTAARARLAYVP